MHSAETIEPNRETIPAAGQSDPRLTHLERRLIEAFDDLWSSFVDPAEPVYDADGTAWNPLGSGLAGGAASVPFRSEQELAAIRNECRWLAAANEFAINGHENRISYIVGSGHTYRAAATRGGTSDEALVLAVQRVIDEFVRLNCWQRRQQEIVRRKDRDGECFLRLFAAADGTTRRAVRRARPGGRAQRSHRRPLGQLRHSDRPERRRDRAGLLDRRPARRRR